MKATMFLKSSVLPLAFIISFAILADARVVLQQITTTGRIVCRVNDRETFPVENATVRLTGSGFLSRFRSYGSTRSGEQGEFAISGLTESSFSGNSPRINLEVEYTYAGIYGKMDVEAELFGRNRRDRTTVNRYSIKDGLGEIVFANDHCRAYVMTFMAMRNYYQRTDGKPLPYDKLGVVTSAPIHAGTPYSTTDKIRIPSGYKYTFEAAQHELAHTVRHSLDGNFAHFLFDVARFKYTQHHSCDKLTNEGFAFNEGWASYWSGQCHGEFGNSVTDFTIEGNVAGAIKGIKLRCEKSDKDFVEVLEKNRGAIHSFGEFQAAHNNLFGCM